MYSTNQLQLNAPDMWLHVETVCISHVNLGEINIISQYFTQPNSRFSIASYMLNVYAIVNLPKFFPTKTLKRLIHQRL